MNRSFCLRRTVAIAVRAFLPAAAIATLIFPVKAQSAPAATGGAGAETAQGDLLAKGESALNSKDYSAAAEAYQQYLAKNPDDARAHFQLGYAYTAMQKMDAARVEYQKATELDPNMGEAFLNLGLAEAATNPTGTLAALHRAVELMPDDAHPAFMLAAALDRAGQTVAAINEYGTALSLDDQDPAIHKAFGAALLRTGRPADAELQFQAAATLDPNDAGNQLELAECFVAEHKSEQAVDAFTAYLKKQPNDTQARLALASVLIDLAKYDDALAQLDSVGMDSGEIRSLKLRYEALAGLKRDDEALAVLVKAASVSPSDMEVHQKLGDSYFQRRNYPAAAHEFQAVLKAAPGNTQAAASLVAAGYDGGDCPAALQAVDLQAQQTPQSPLPLRSLFIRASCYDKLGEKPKALESYDAFLSANKDQTSDMYFAATERVRDLRRESGNNNKK